MTAYTAGLLFSEEEALVALILKKRGPDNVRGRLNAIGGHVEPGESPADCQAREFREETGLHVPPEAWTETVELRGPDWVVHFFRATVPRDVLLTVETTTDEEVSVCEVRSLGAVMWHPLHGEVEVVRNLRWIIPLSVDRSVRFPVVLTEGLPRVA